MRALLRKIRSRLERHTLDHDFVSGSLTALLSRRGHDHFGVLNPIDDFPKHRVLLIKRRLFLERDKPLTVRAVNVLRARRTKRSTLVGNVAELGGHIRVRRTSGAPRRAVALLR